jgi:hypothetical protein
LHEHHNRRRPLPKLTSRVASPVLPRTGFGWAPFRPRGEGAKRPAGGSRGNGAWLAVEAPGAAGLQGPATREGRPHGGASRGRSDRRAAAALRRRAPLLAGHRLRAVRRDDALGQRGLRRG